MARFLMTIGVVVWVCFALVLARALTHKDGMSAVATVLIFNAGAIIFGCGAIVRAIENNAATVAAAVARKK